jgi:site-specific recombinase XerD
LRQHRARQAEARIAAGSLLGDHALIFTTDLGTSIDPDHFSHDFSKLSRNAGLGHWHPYELRHSVASLMLAQGTPLPVVSEVLGHASITTTLDLYGSTLARWTATPCVSTTRPGKLMRPNAAI